MFAEESIEIWMSAITFPFSLSKVSRRMGESPWRGRGTVHFVYPLICGVRANISEDPLSSVSHSLLYQALSLHGCGGGCGGFRFLIALVEDHHLMSVYSFIEILHRNRMWCCLGVRF